MIYISTYPLPGEKFTEFADAHAEDMGYELFYDNLSRLSAGSYKGRMKELIEQEKCLSTAPWRAATCWLTTARRLCAIL